VNLVADNLHGLNPVVAEAMKKLDPKPVQELVQRCEQKGAAYIDINPGHLSQRNEDRITFLVEAVQEAGSGHLILDSPNPRVLARGLEACQETPIISALSLEEQKLNEILPLAADHGTDLVILLMDERSFTPPTLEEKLALALELRERAMAAGIASEKLIFDPVLPNLTWDDALLRVAEDVKTVRLISSGAIFQESGRTMVGLSNLRSGQRKHHPFKLEETCMALFAGAGLTFLLADVLQPGFDEVFQDMSRLT
jgi:5-methyltetrahydrofolate corrinoid/iron sulfur protein methyltransferase